MKDAETPYTIKEVAALIGLSVRTVTELFEREPGVIVYERPNKQRRRASYRTIRVPRSVFQRVVLRLTVR